MAKSLTFGYKGFLKQLDKYGSIRKSSEVAQLRTLDNVEMDRFKALVKQSLINSFGDLRDKGRVNGLSPNESKMVQTMVDYTMNQILNPNSKDKIQAAKEACEKAGWTISGKGKIGNPEDTSRFSKDSLQNLIL